MDAKRDLMAGIAEPVERRQRHGHVVSDAADIHYDTIGVLLEDGAAKVRDHGR
jgi:hypothetical protein